MTATTQHSINTVGVLPLAERWRQRAPGPAAALRSLPAGVQWPLEPRGPGEQLSGGHPGPDGGRADRV